MSYINPCSFQSTQKGVLTVLIYKCLHVLLTLLTALMKLWLVIGLIVYFFITEKFSLCRWKWDLMKHRISRIKIKLKYATTWSYFYSQFGKSCFNLNKNSKIDSGSFFNLNKNSKIDSGKSHVDVVLNLISLCTIISGTTSSQIMFCITIWIHSESMKVLLCMPNILRHWFTTYIWCGFAYESHFTELSPLLDILVCLIVFVGMS